MSKKTQLKELSEQAQLIVKNCKEQRKNIAQANSYWFYVKKSIWHLLTEKENLLFALLQWAAIGLAYYLFVIAMNWIPPEMWEAIGNDNDSVPISVCLIFWAWGMLCVGLAAYPIGLLTGCMSASAILKSEGKESTVADCLKMVVPFSWIVWSFSWFDGWLTVEQILERLPKKNDRTPRAVKIAKEGLYQAWKLCSLGFLPSIIYGKSFIQAGTESLKFLQNRFWVLSKLRIVHIVICWVIGVGCFVGGIIFIIAFPSVVGGDLDTGNTVYKIYMGMCIPLLFSLALLLVVFRPIYITAATYIYVDYAQETSMPRQLPKPSSRTVSALVAFIILCVLMGIIILFRDQLGITSLFDGTTHWG